MVIRVMYIIELLDTEEGGLELVDPSWCPDEGPPRKKIKSPPVISPTGSSTSLYSGGSSIDWTTTGTTLEMQGTRVTRTQYGFRTLQESSAKMCLKVTGYPLPEITWYKEDQLLKEDDRHTFYADEDGFFAMTVDPVQVEDTGRYTCVATNEYGQASTSAFFRVLKVEKEAAPPAFTTTLKDQECKEGEVVSFECDVEGWPEPELVWLVDDQPLRPSHDFRLEYDGQNAKLEIRDAQPDDSGTYAVKITNEYGVTETKAQLVVQPDPDKNHVAPEFQSVVEDVECDEGDSVRFKSVLTGDPVPEVVWFINGIPLTPSEKIKMINEDGICILTIKDVTRHFDGMVTCQGKNRLGTTSCEGRLKVRVPPKAPQFDKPLDDRTVTEKTSVSFDCDVSGYPDPTVEFFLNGKPLKNGQDGVEILQQDNHYKIIIQNTNIDKHDGEILARATNQHGQAESRARLVVEPEEEESRSAPTFIKDIEDQTVKFGEKAVFETTVRGSPNPTVKWFINGAPLDVNSQGVQIVSSGSDHKLTIDSTHYAGTILCRAENSVGRFETKARLIVLPAEKPKKAPVFKEQLKDKAENEGNAVIFEVEVDAEPRAEYIWTLNGQRLVESDRVKFREFNGSSKVEIRDLRLDEAGKISCTARNSEGEATTEAVLTVNKKPKQPSFDQRPKSITVERGTEAVFEAHADGVPAPVYQWSVGGRKIKETTHGAKIETDANGVSRLTLDTNAFYESATISVTAENAAGVDETGCSLTVEEPPPPQKKTKLDEKVAEQAMETESLEETKGLEDSTGKLGEAAKSTEEKAEVATVQEIQVETFEDTTKLEIVRPLVDQTVEKGEKAQFSTAIRGAENVEWSVDGKQVKHDGHEVIIAADEYYDYKLTIDSSKYAGTVACRAVSRKGEAVETTAKLIVTEKVKPKEKPEFSQKLRDITVKEDEQIKEEVVASNEPNFKWDLNGKPLKDGENGVRIVTEGNKSTLIIEKATQEHKGRITVVAQNEAGSVDSSSQLTVEPKNIAPKIIEGPRNVTITEKETIEFTTVVTGVPAPKVRWELNEKVVEEHHESVSITQQDNRHTLKISNVKVEQAGSIEVIAENIAGTDRAKAKVEVKRAETKPAFKSTLQDTKVDEGAPLRLDVELENPSPGTKVSWLLDGKPLNESEKIKIVDDGNGKHHIEIKEATPDMSGTITCKAENAQGSAETKAKIEVVPKGQKPEFTKLPQDQVTEEENSIKFSAVVTGVPTPTISWYLNEQLITSSEEIRVKYEEETGKTSIRIFKPSVDQSGKVRVKAENKAGQAEATAQLKVEKKGVLPNFLTDLKDRQVNENTDVKFTAKIAAFPEPEITWTLNDQPIKASNAKITREGDVYSLEFTKVQLDQAGEIACTAKNSVGHAKQNCTLIVKEFGQAPIFSRNLEDRLVEENETLFMEAKLEEVKPKPTVQWLQDGKPFESNEHVKLVQENDGTLKLTILRTELTDKSRITIKAENSYGSAETSASIGVQKKRSMKKPEFLSTIAPITITEGDTLNTKVLIAGDPEPYAKWYINNIMVYQTEDTEIKNENGVYSLTIHGCTTDMTGTIKCVAGNKMGEATTEGKLTVIAPIPVEFETSLCDATCREGDTLKLKAVLLGEPTPVVTWYVNGKKLVESQNIKIHAEKGTYTVTIKDITCDYSGKVVCEAVNEFGKASSEATLLVLPRGEPPDFLEWLSNIRARPGSAVTHKVVFTGDPRPTLTWYINNKEVKDGVDGISIKTDDKTSILTINSFNPEKHVGEIICKAENEAGEVSCTANMATYTSEMASESESEAMAEDLGKEEDLTENEESLREEVQRTPTPINAPKFITKIKDTKVKKGQTAVFECVVPDTKGVCCKWLKDGKEIELIARIRVQTRTIEGFTTNELVIDDVTPEDAGRYTVIVENSAGMDRCEANLTVIESLEKKPQRSPEFVVKLSDKSTNVAEKVVLECKVVGEPEPQVKWYHETKEVSTKEERMTIESNAEGIQRLIIENVAKEDEGRYACKAENVAGTAQTEATLTVLGADDGAGRGPPEFVELLKSATTTINGEAVLRCRVKGEPRPTIKWTKEGKEVEMSARIRTEYLEDGTITFTVKQSVMEDSGEYRCEATNEFGSAWTEAPIIVVKEGTIPTTGEAPDFLEPVRPVTVMQGETAVLEGKITGSPAPEVKWYRGKELITPATDSRYKVENLANGTQRLTIKDAKLEDMGEFRCEASNEYGDVWSDVTLTVKLPATVETGGEEQVAPTFVKALEEIRVQESEQAEFECIVAGEPKPEVKWYKDSKEIQSNDKHFVQTQQADGTARLTIKTAELGDAGQFRCEAKNAAGTARTEAPLTVSPAGPQLRLKRGLEDQNVNTGVRIILSVEVEGKPKTVKWFKGNDEIKSSKRTKIEKITDEEYKLEIEKAELSDSGPYRVVLSTETESVESSCKVTVTEGVEKPSFKKGLSDQSVPKGSPLTLEIEVEGKPKEIKWLKDGKPVDESRAKPIDLGNGKYALKIAEMKDEDFGGYTVQISNEAGQAESSAAVKEAVAKPEIVKGLQPANVSAGEPAAFEVEVKGPVKAVKWYKNGKELTDAQTEEVAPNKYRLIIPSTKAEDAGDYKVVLSNDAGQADSSAALTVKTPAAAEPLKFVKGLEDQVAQKGDKVILEIETNKKPKEVKWYKNGKEITPKDHAEPKKVSDTVYQLVIPDADLEDSGPFKVVVTNDDDVPSDSSAQLTVKLPAAEPLKFLKGLEDQVAQKGDKVVLEIETNKKPKQVKWYKNGKEITPKDHAEPKKVSDTVYQLVIPDADLEDSGQFKVVVTNDDDVPSDSSCSLTVKLPAEEPSEPPRFVKGLEDQTIPIGSPLELVIETTGKPKTVKWYKNGKEVAGAAKVKIEKIDDNNYKLTIPKSALDDSGEYAVEIENPAGKARSEGRVTVEPVPDFLKPLKDLEVTEGEKAEFTVETNCKPRTVKWYKNGQEIHPDARVEFKGNDTKYSLVIKEAKKEDAGTYKVVIENTAGQKDSSAKLTVKKPLPDQPRIIKGLEDQIVAKGDALIFEVKVEGEVTELRWLKDGQKVVNATIEKLDDNTYRLTIPKSEVSDAGKYEVQAINEAGKATSSANAEVDEKPEIVKGLIPINIDEGEDHIFRVEVSKPVRQVKWYKNGQEIKPDAHLVPKQVSPKKYELAINKALLDDGATYKVVLSNRAGECDSSAELTVTKPNILKLLKGLEDVTVNDGEPFELSCKIQGEPKTVKWLKNGEEVSPSDRVIIKANPETGEYSLSVPESNLKDGGAYRVIFTNERGEIHSGAVAHVKAKKPSATSPNFLTPLADVEIPEGETLTLTCKVGGEPQPQLKWYKNGSELTPDARTSIRLGLDGTATLRIRDAKKSDEGDYRVEATNEAGTNSSSCKATVLPVQEAPSAPKFVIPLRPQSVAVGSTAEFNVKVRGNPKPTLAWFLNDQPIAIDGARISLIDMHDGHWTLKVKDFQESDYGTLKCIAKNEHGTDECLAVIKPIDEKARKGRDEEGYPPRFNVPLWDRRILDGQQTWIECHVDAKPRADIVWTKDGEEVKESEYIHIDNSPEGTCKIKINRFVAEHIGTYKCTASNIYGVADTEGILRIEVEELVEVEKKKEYAPRFNPPLEDKTLNGGQTLSLRCVVDAIPTASIVWYKDGLPLRRTDKLLWEYNPESGECKLTVTDVNDSDQGAYRCVASNTIGSTNTACNVIVKTKKEEVKKVGAEPFFTKGLTDKWVDRGDTLTLQCAVTGDPEPTTKWYRNGILLKPSNRVSIETTPDGQITLVVKDCTMSDEGIYRCEAENAHGKAKTQSTAHVQMTLGKIGKPTQVELGEAPRFLVPLEDLSVTVGSAIELECKVTGQPMPQVKWSKDGGALHDDYRYEWKNDPKAGTYRLKIRDANTYDEGTYRCLATNESGSATTKAFIRVNEGVSSTLSYAPSAAADKAVSPRFAVKLSDARAQEGQPLVIECKVEGFPLPELVWYKDGEKVYPSDRIKFEQDPDGNSRLVIPSCRASDDGIYRVIATNPHGSAHDKATATIKKAAGAGPVSDRGSTGPEERFDVSKAPKLITPLESVRVPEKQPFTLRCKFSGDPKPTIKWFKDGERVYAFGHCQISEKEDGTCELSVDSAQRSDGGCYRCVAENIYGSARTTCEVTIQLKEKKPQKTLEDQLKEGNAPGFTIPLTMKKVKAGETVVFECLPYGNPFPAIKWLKDGIEVTSSSGIKIEALPDGTQRLTIESVDFLSEGYYRCVATNDYGTASTKAELELLGDRTPKTNGVLLTNGGPPGEPEESKPKIKRGLYNMSIHQGSPVEMQVVATGWPTPTVKWYKNGEELVPEGAESKRVIWTDERNVHHLLILNASPEDEGEYSLVATNKLGEAKTEGALSIIRPREVQPHEDGVHDGQSSPPGFIRQLKNKHVFSHMPTIFDCLVVGHPSPQVDWYHNGQKILPGGRYKIQATPGGSHALIILDTLPEDEGEYVAIARNSHGQASSSAVLDVTIPHLDNIKFDGSFDVTPYLTEEYGFKKLNLHSLPTPPDRGPFIKEVTGHYLTLSWIPTKRSPPRYPQVTYVVEIRELPYKEWSLLEYNIPEPVCKVRNLELGKSYQFRVRAENIYGISDPSPASPPSRLMARPQPVMDKNKKIIPLLDPYAEKALDELYGEQYACAPWFAPGVVEKRYCAENDTLTITLSVSGYPDPKIQWKFRGWDVDTSSPTSNIRVANYGGAETTITVHGFSKNHAGQYQCIATNPYGEAQQNIHVEVATRPNFIQPLINKTFSDGRQMKLDVRVEGNPFPEIKWMKEWHPLAESSRIKFVQDGPYLCSLIIDNPIWRDSGIYSCVATNDAGQATTSCSVTIEAENEYEIELPKKKIALEARKVREIYEIEEEDEKKAAAGAPFRVIERATGKKYIGQLKPLDEDLKRNLAMHNILDDLGMIQVKQAISDQGLAVVVFENADRSLFDTLLAPVPTTEDSTENGYGKNREDQVRVFIKQLLTALQYMHHRNIAHLDLRPEVILLQDDHLRLADFGQSRHLLRGKASGDIKGSPEFVPPEVVLGKTVTLAADMWSSGVLAYVLLSGSSPFLGDNDNETLNNVVHGEYTLDIPDLSDVSADARDFLIKLLVVDQFKRLTVDEALNHPWLADPALKDAKLATDCLREFKYRHKWLERRVFVQQTPSAELTQFIEAPLPTIAEVNRINGHQQGQAEPRSIYDYLKIKDTPQVHTYGSKQIDPRKAAQLRQALLQGRTQNGDIPSSLGAPFDQLPPNVRLPPGVHPQDLYGPPFNGHPLDPRLQRFAPFDQMGPLPVGKNGPHGEQDKRRLQPQEKGETPLSQNGHVRSSKRQSQIPDYTALAPQEDSLEDIVPVPTRLLRGEHREIEEEIANRILSDISEENSVAGSLASIDDFEPILPKTPRDNRKTRGGRKSRSRSSTPQAEASDISATPLASPAPPMETIDPIVQFFGDQTVPQIPELLDPKVPVGAPLFLEGLAKHVTVSETPTRPRTPAGLSPRPTTPGTKSPVMISPGREYSMECVIATKRGKQGKTEPISDTTAEIKPHDDAASPKKAQRKIHDKEFDNLMDEVEKIKRKHEMEKDMLADLDKYRPKNFYKEQEYHKPEVDVDDFPWESNYQIGPDTFLLATKGPAFNSRVRDYRRELWGDGAPLVRQGILGFRNQDITVRERRRYTDLIREDPNIAQTPAGIASQHAQPGGAVHRIQQDIKKLSPIVTRKNPDGTFGSIFRSRLRDACLRDGVSSISLECYAMGNPQPQITWYFQERPLADDGHYKITHEGDLCRLTIANPTSRDIGEYTCVASNEHGTDKCYARVMSGQAPDRPGRPVVELSSDTEVFITWDPPEISTCLEGIAYKLECRPAGDKDYNAAWSIIDENIENEAVVVKHLNPLGIYQFRVTAGNGFGWGIPSLTSRIIRTHMRGAPKLHIDVLRSEVQLSVVTMPQRTARNAGLTGISEQDEEEEELDEESESSTRSEISPLFLNTSDDPTKRFQLESELFRGKFSLVRNAVDTKSRSQKHCVAKIRVAPSDALGVTDEFENLKECQHENVVRLIAGYYKENFVFLFTEKLHENVFERFTYLENYNEEQICLVVRQLASALHWIHFRGIVHLDIQPNNVMFISKRAWQIKLIDFENSQLIGDNIKKPENSNPEWAAPEILKEDGQVTSQTDVWGLGIITFCLLAGFHPFSSDDDTVEEVRENVLKQKCDPNLIPVQATQEALIFATWALKKHPIRRIHTNEAMSHRWLSNDATMTRRREGVKYSSNRLRRTVARTMKRPRVEPDPTLLARFSANKS